MKKKLLALPLLLANLMMSSPAWATPPAPVYPLPTQAQVDWHNMELTAFIHFTTNTFTGLEWGFGDEKPEIFNPDGVHAHQWVSVLKDAGFKGIILTAKHHDGFCIWPSKYTEHSIKNSPYLNGKGDIVKAVSDECKKQNVQFGIYLSPWDRNHPQYGKPEYIEYYRNQLVELFTNYGPAFEMWFDGANGGTGYYGGAYERRDVDRKTYYDWPKTLDLVRSMEPNIIFFSDAGPGVRWVGNEEGWAGKTNWNTINLDTIYAGKPGIRKLLNTGEEHGTSWVPAECDVSIRPGWFYHKHEDKLVKSPQQLFDIYLTSVGRGSVMLLNVPPDRRGKFHENDVESLKGFRKLLDQEFKTDLTQKATITATNTRENNDAYSVKNLNDGNNNTYWATDDNNKTAQIEVDFKKKQTVKYITLKEYIQLGQRVKSFCVDAMDDNGNWIEVANETTIGHKRILRLESPVHTNKIRIRITDSKACPVLSQLAIY